RRGQPLVPAADGRGSGHGAARYRRSARAQGHRHPPRPGRAGQPPHGDPVCRRERRRRPAPRLLHLPARWLTSKTLDLDTLRTLVTAADLDGYGRAAERLGRTPSAVSLQMKRLQDDVGVPLFRKSGRGLVLTEAGETVLRYGRRMLALN